jgi:hypothetical protein
MEEVSGKMQGHGIKSSHWRSLLDLSSELRKNSLNLGGRNAGEGRGADALPLAVETVGRAT